jgi:serine/threonine protein kinase
MSSVRMIGQYEIRALLGEGGIGQVHAARDTMLDREVAIKSLRPELMNDTSFVDRFRSEANSLARLTHPNITTLYSLLPDGGNLYMIMELVRGRTLELILKEKGAPFSISEALAIIGQAADGLSYAHSMGVVHRDIKPANMMVTDAGLVKIMDFGIARVQGSQRMTRAGSAFGTPEYMSPEQVKGQDVDARSDLYSLAIVLYEMLTGCVPFSANTDYELGQLHINAPPERPSRRISNLDPVVDKALMRALSKKADDRFESVAAFKAALGATTPPQEAATIVRRATRLVGALPGALAASPAMSSVSLAVSSVSSAVGERVDKSTIPFALKGIAVGAGAAIVIAAAIILIWRPSTPPAPATQAQAVPATSPPATTISVTAPCGWSQDSMFYRPCAPGQTPASGPAQPITGNVPSKGTSVPTSQGGGGGAKKVPFEPSPEPSAGRPGENAKVQGDRPRTADPQAPAVVARATPQENPASRPPNATVADPSEKSGKATRVAPPQADVTAPPAAAGTAGDPATPAPDVPAVAGGAGAEIASPAQQTAEAATAPAQPQQKPEAKKPTEAEVVAAYQQKNYGAALELAEPAARDGCVECQFIMGRLLEMGVAGKKDPSAAADWYRKAADGGLAKARFNLGGMYLVGDGVLKDARTAAEWFHKAASQGYSAAQFNLGMMYEKGEGIGRDIPEAIKWYAEAAKSSDASLAQDAQAAIERLDQPERSSRRRRR